MTEEILQAYALGALEPDEIRKLRSSTGAEKFNHKDLGRYQNLAALLTSALTLETPDEKLKEKLARKLYRINSETGVKKNKQEVVSRDLAREIIKRSTSQSSERYIRIKGETKPLAGETIRSREINHIKLDPVKFTKPRRDIFVAAVALLSGILLGFFFFYENKDPYISEITKLNGEIQNLNSEIMTNTGLMTLLEKRDTRIYSLSGTEAYPDGSGKIFVNSSSNRAYLYITDLVNIEKSKSCQLWILNSGSAIPAGLFNTDSGSSYFYFTFPQTEINRSTLFIITEEPKSGSSRPGNKILLTTGN